MCTGCQAKLIAFMHFSVNFVESRGLSCSSEVYLDNKTPELEAYDVSTPWSSSSFFSSFLAQLKKSFGPQVI